MCLTENSFIEALNNNQGIIYKVANSYARNRDDRDDLIQEISLQLWRSWSRYNGTSKVSTWMYKVSLNVAISFFRKHYRKQIQHVSINEDIRFIEEGNEIELSENLKYLYFFIAQLNELNKALILLYLDKFSYDEIAETLGITRTNVATKIHRIKNQLKEKMNPKTVQDGHK